MKNRILLLISSLFMLSVMQPAYAWYPDNGIGLPFSVCTDNPGNMSRQLKDLWVAQTALSDLAKCSIGYPKEVRTTSKDSELSIRWNFIGEWGEQADLTKCRDAFAQMVLKKYPEIKHANADSCPGANVQPFYILHDMANKITGGRVYKDPFIKPLEEGAAAR
jgi:hypothetical protein